MSGVITEHITVSEHAALRWLDRVDGKVPPKAGRERHEMMNVANIAIRAEVTEAIREGRKAKRKPRWACRTDYRPKMRTPANDMRYAWNATESICFALRREEKKAWVVVTIVTGETK